MALRFDSSPTIGVETSKNCQLWLTAITEERIPCLEFVKEVVNSRLDIEVLAWMGDGQCSSRVRYSAASAAALVLMGMPLIPRDLSGKHEQRGLAGDEEPPAGVSVWE